VGMRVEDNDLVKVDVNHDQNHVIIMDFELT
jgi:hypothetical protein